LQGGFTYGEGESLQSVVVGTLLAADTEFNHLAGTFHEHVKVFRLGVASPQRGYHGNEVARFVTFDHDCEFSLRFSRVCFGF
jgi:hypothetical protein